MIPSFGPAVLRVLAARLASSFRGRERAALRDLADARRHAQELGAIASAWETVAREPTHAAFVRALHVLAEALRRDGNRRSEARAVLLAALRVADRMLSFRRHFARADVEPDTAASIARDAFADLDAYERATRAYDTAAEAEEPSTPFAEPVEDIWEGEGGALAPTTGQR